MYDKNDCIVNWDSAKEVRCARYYKRNEWKKLTEGIILES